MGNKVPLQSKIKGIDVVTGLPATTGGPYASPNAVKPFDHPEAVEAQRRNKTGAFADPNATGKSGPISLEDLMNEERAKADAKAAQINKVRDDTDNKKPVLGGVKSAPTPVSTDPKTPGTQAAANAASHTSPPVSLKTPAPIPLKQPQGMNKPAVSSQHIQTSTVQPPKTTQPVITTQEGANEAGNTSQAGETALKTEGSENT